MSTDSSKQNTYFFDAESPAEMARLIHFDQLLTSAMGGPLAEQPDSTVAAMRKILDLACGPGGWVLDTAYDYPRIEIAGVDISRTMIDFARARARDQQLTNASFSIMDITQPLNFPSNTFDLVNSRLLVVVLYREAWQHFISECYRITRPGGIIRLTEFDELGLTNSPAYEELKTVMLYAIRQKYGFSPDGRTHGLTPVLGHLLRSVGYRDIQRKAHVIDFSANMPSWADLYEHTKVLSLLAKPLYLKVGLSEEKFDQLYQQMLIEMKSNEFCGVLTYQTIWATKPQR